ncbi:MAG: hypothetical protein NHG06_00040 [Candidatus Shikimatogenerans sp. JK-2022]|nr:hypothetical protein [Candidatus Shikimatogenerans bostrichidophilus]
MFNIKKQLQYIYSIHLLEEDLKYNYNIFYSIPKIINHNLKKIKTCKNNKKKIKNKYIKYKNIIANYKIKKDNYNNLINKYNLQIKFITRLKEFNKLYQEKKYIKLKYKYIKKKIDNKYKIYNKLKKRIKILNKRYKIIKYKVKYKNLIYNKIYFKYKEKIYNIKKLLLNYISIIKNYKIYNKYIFIKTHSKDNIGIVTLYKKRSVENTYLTIPKYKYYYIYNKKKISYDDYTGKILIDDKFSKYIKNKIKNKLINP